MDIAFWQSIQNSEFSVPAGYSLEALTDVLMSQIGVPDSEMREVTYDILSEWILAGMYTPAYLRQLIDQLVANLQFGLGTVDNDSVFTRSFSVLLLGETVNYDNEVEYLREHEVRDILQAVLNYLGRERDVREKIEGKGWSHALEHTKLCLTDILSSRYMTDEDKARINTQI